MKARIASPNPEDSAITFGESSREIQYAPVAHAYFHSFLIFPLASLGALPLLPPALIGIPFFFTDISSNFHRLPSTSSSFHVFGPLPFTDIDFHFVDLIPWKLPPTPMEASMGADLSPSIFVDSSTGINIYLLPQKLVYSLTSLWNLPWNLVKASTAFGRHFHRRRNRGTAVQ